MRDNLQSIRENHPLILNLTNYVTMDIIANGLLAIGASPIMSNSIEELDEIINLASAIVINIGTLDNNQIQLFKKAADICKKLDKKLVLDPVGAGATSLRTKTSLDLLATGAIKIIKGNASEIMSLVGLKVSSKGVDSVNVSNEAEEAARIISKKYDICVIVSGANDIVIDNDLLFINKSGSPLMSKITGMGCLLTSIVAAFYAITDDRFTASSNAVKYFGAIGEVTGHESNSPAKFRMAFIDNLYNSIG